jgi:hypothetical protein
LHSALEIRAHQAVILDTHRSFAHTLPGMQAAAIAQPPHARQAHALNSAVVDGMRAVAISAEALPSARVKLCAVGQTNPEGKGAEGLPQGSKPSMHVPSGGRMPVLRYDAAAPILPALHLTVSGAGEARYTGGASMRLAVRARHAGLGAAARSRTATLPLHVHFG